jgi:hypothetical protein
MEALTNMLVQDYSYYLYKLLLGGIFSLAGMLIVLFLVGAFAALELLKTRNPRIRMPAFWSLMALAVIALVVSFYTSFYEFEEHPETLVFEGLPLGAPDCGTAWTGWIKGAYGISNPCPWGCYRGIVLRKQLRMSGFPPWPEYRRELQCWRREQAPGELDID